MFCKQYKWLGNRNKQLAEQGLTLIDKNFKPENSGWRLIYLMSGAKNDDNISYNLSNKVVFHKN